MRRKRRTINKIKEKERLKIKNMFKLYGDGMKAMSAFSGPHAISIILLMSANNTIIKILQNDNLIIIP